MNQGKTNYHLPSSTTDVETERLNSQHIALTNAIGGRLSIAPLTTEQRQNAHVLDMGCGSGIWIKDYARQNPDAKVYGVDLTPPETTADLPPNCQLLKGSLEADWSTWMPVDLKFDLIYCRYLAWGIHDWPALLRKARDYLKPNGWIEAFEPRATLHVSGNQAFAPSVNLQTRLHAKYLKEQGVDDYAAMKIGDWMRNIGFQYVKERPLHMMYDLLEKGRVNLSRGIEPGFEASVSKLMGWSSYTIYGHITKHLRNQLYGGFSDAEVAEMLKTVREDMLKTPSADGYIYLDA